MKNLDLFLLSTLFIAVPIFSFCLFETHHDQNILRKLPSLYLDGGKLKNR